MDSSISANYRNIVFTFRIKFWEVYSAIHISSGIEVSIWKFIYHDINSRYSEDEILSFLSKYRSSLVASQHIYHFNILRIFEISEENENLSFSSERIIAPFSQEKNLTNDEACFIISQLSNTINYLHSELHVVHFAISPDNIFISPNFNLKLANFVHFAKFSDFNSIVEPNVYPLSTSIFDIDPHFASPEIKNHKPLTPLSDVYSFAIFLIYIFTNEIPTKFPISKSKLRIPDEYKEIVSRCLQENPDKRPTFDQISSVISTNPLTIRVLNYLSKINENSIESKRNFFKKLSGIISDYSPRILSQKIIPIIVKETNDYKELSQQLLEILLLSSEKIESIDVYNLVVSPLFKEEEHAEYFFEKALTMTNASIFIPILIAAFKTNIKSISSRKNELLKSIIALENVKTVFPMLGDFDNESIIESFLQVCHSRVEIPDSLLFIQQLKKLFKKFGSNINICNSIASVLVTIDPNVEYASKCVSLSFNLINSFISKDNKEKLIDHIEKFVVVVRDSVESNESSRISASQSSSQNLILADDETDEIIPRKSRKEKKHKERKGRRSSLTASGLKKLDLSTMKNNSFSNSQSLFALPRGINPLILKNVFETEIDPFQFREYINASKPPFSLRNDLDPFELLNENRRRNSELTPNVDTSSENEENPTDNIVHSVTPERKKTPRIDKSHRRSLSNQTYINLSSFELQEVEADSMLLCTTNVNTNANRSDNLSDDDSGPFKVSKKSALLSSSIGSGFPNVFKNYSSSNNLKSPLSKGKSTEQVSVGNSSKFLSSSQTDLRKRSRSYVPPEAKNGSDEQARKNKISKQKRLMIPTPPKKPKNINDE